MEQKKYYSWCTINSLNYQDVFDNKEEAIRDAMWHYEHKEDDNRFANDNSVIMLGEVEFFDIEAFVKNFMSENFKDLLHEALDDFAAGTDCETEVFIHNQRFQKKITQSLLPIIKDEVYIYPQSKMFKSRLYDLKKKVFC